MGTMRTSLTGLIGTYASKGNTVFFRAHLNDIQQFPIIPVTERFSESFTAIRALASLNIIQEFLSKSKN